MKSYVPFNYLNFCTVYLVIQFAFLTGCGSNTETPAANNTSPSVKISDNLSNQLETDKKKNHSQIKQPVSDEEVISSESPIPINKLISATHVDKNNRIWIDNKPYDVWFKNPLKVLGDSTLLSFNNKIQQKPHPIPNTDQTKDLPDSNNKGNQSTINSDPLWQKFITAEIIQNEVKSIRNRLNSNFRSVGQFNKSQEEIDLDCTMLISLSYLVESEDFSVSWKKKASKMIQLSISISESASTRGRKNFKIGKSYFDQLSSLLEGNQSAESTSKISNELSEMADRSSVMLRMEQINKLLESEITTKKEFENNRLKLIHETSLLAILANTILHKSYESSNEEEYQKPASLMLKEALELSNAANENQYSKWNEMKNRIRIRCDECHAEYRL